jgi:light-regulated signal transduction histidine kinase (bacteriophytochrome)
MLIDTLKNELGDEQSSEILQITDMISDKSTKLITMIERLLKFSKMCNITPEFEMLDLEDIIRTAVEEQLSVTPNRQVSLIMGTIPQICGDAVLIEMLITNLISNAFKFTQTRQNAIITVSAIPDENYNIISIKDNGVGFDMAYQDKLFKVFQRLHMSDEFEGSGVGLAIVERIMKRHGGKVEAFGEVDKGAEFRLYFLKQ